MDITDIVVEQQPAASPKLGLPPEGHGRRSFCIRRTAPPRNAHADLAAAEYAAEITTQGLRLRHELPADRTHYRPECSVTALPRVRAACNLWSRFFSHRHSGQSDAGWVRPDDRQIGMRDLDDRSVSLILTDPHFRGLRF